jgi:hypothetical protein
MSQSPDLLVKAIAHWAGLKTYLRLAVATRQLRYQPLDHRRLVRDLSEKATSIVSPTSVILMLAAWVLERPGKLDERELRQVLSSNLCRCDCRRRCRDCGSA